MSLKNRLKIGVILSTIVLGCFLGEILFEILVIIHILSILEVTFQISQASITPRDKAKWFSYYILSIVPLTFSLVFLRPRDTLLWTSLLINVTNDVMQFLWGKYCPNWFISKRKIGIISPQKTFRGYFLGISTSVIFLHQIVSVNYILLFVLLILASLGDLWLSFLKRKLGIKHYGTMLDSHGGITDREDSFLFSTPFLVFYSHYVQPCLI